MLTTPKECLRVETCQQVRHGGWGKGRELGNVVNLRSPHKDRNARICVCVCVITRSRFKVRLKIVSISLFLH